MATVHLICPGSFPLPRLLLMQSVFAICLLRSSRAACLPACDYAHVMMVVYLLMVQFWTTPKGVRPERERVREREIKREQAVVCALCENAAAHAASAAAVGGLSDEYILQLQLQLEVAKCRDAAAKRQSIKCSTFRNFRDQKNRTLFKSLTRNSTICRDCKCRFVLS